MKITFNIKSFLLLSLAFVLFTIIGTVTHEYGHILVAKHFGYQTTLHYGSMHYEPRNKDELMAVYTANKTTIEQHRDFEGRAEYESAIKELRHNGLLVTMGGPLQTMLTGLVGLAILFVRRGRIAVLGMKTVDWLGVFLSLFWLREVFNPFTSITGEMLSPDGSYFGGDEKYLSVGLGLWEGSLPVVTGILGLAISLFVIFRVIPERQRLTFIVSGLTGGIIGFILWMYILGPLVLPQQAEQAPVESP